MSQSNLQALSNDWMTETIEMAVEQGYRVTPLFENGFYEPYRKGQTYLVDNPVWSKSGVVNGVVPVLLDRVILLDDDGHKKDGAVTQTALEFEMGIDLEPHLVQENHARNSRHFLFKFPDDADLNEYSQANNGNAIKGWDIKCQNQPIHIKQEKILNDGELPLLSQLSVAPDYILDILRKDSKDECKLYTASVGEKSNFFRYLEHKGYEYSHTTDTGHRFFHPEATTKSAGTVLSIIDGVEKVKAFDSGKLNTGNDSHAHDLASVIEVLEGLSKSDAFTKETQVLLGNFDFNPNSLESYQLDTKKLYKMATKSVCSILGVESLPKGTIKPAVIEKVMCGATWYAQQGKYYLMNQDSDFIPVREKDAIIFFSRAFGAVIDVSKIGKEIQSTATLTEVEFDKVESRVRAKVWNTLFEELRYRKHMTAISYKVDMFIKTGYVQELNDGVYKVVRPHKAFSTAPYNQTVIDDFKTHFPQFDEFLDLLVAGRFADDRKNAYLWIQAVSDFGKGLLNGALSNHGLVVSMTAKETEAIFEGKPSSRQASDFFRAWVLSFNEFKSVKSELKELESEIQLSPKNQMVQIAEIYTKVFYSADGVASMTGEHGVESQFANRFSYWKLHGEITKRPLFKEIGKGAYRRSLEAYIGQYLNEAVEKMRGLGFEGASKQAGEYLDSFHSKHGIANTFGDTKDNIQSIADEFKQWCIDTNGLETHAMDSGQR